MHYKILNYWYMLCSVIAIMILPTKAESWSFGVMGDTQWGSNEDGENPGSVAVGVIKQVNSQFIGHRVRFVVQVGDLVDIYSKKNGGFTIREEVCQELYEEGIGFYPLRGNHDDGKDAAHEFPKIFPQTTGNGPNVSEAWGFSSPDSSLEGLTYSFKYLNATFVLIDQFTRGYGSVVGLDDQIKWLDTVLASRPSNTHAFVFSHKGLCGGYHTDGLFGQTPAALPDIQNEFYRTCVANGVRYLICGHDHIHQRSLMMSPDRLWNIQQIITASNSHKFYSPLTGSVINDRKYNNQFRETPLSQELYTIGYYIVTIDGSIVTIDFYSSENSCGGNNCHMNTTPRLSFSKRETFGYSLNGKKFLIKQEDSFASIADTIPSNESYHGTSMAINECVNSITATFSDGRAAINEVCTGWRSSKELGKQYFSDILVIRGMQDSIGSFKGDPYGLSISYDSTYNGSCVLMTQNDQGEWIPAVDRIKYGTDKFVLGPWVETYTLGTYGLNPITKTVWAVIDYDGEFIVGKSTDGDMNGDGIIDDTDISEFEALVDSLLNIEQVNHSDDDTAIGIIPIDTLLLGSYENGDTAVTYGDTSQTMVPSWSNWLVSDSGTIQPPNSMGSWFPSDSTGNQQGFSWGNWLVSDSGTIQPPNSMSSWFSSDSNSNQQGITWSNWSLQKENPDTIVVPQNDNNDF